jgi:hypothetical protein
LEAYHWDYEIGCRLLAVILPTLKSNRCGNLRCHSGSDRHVALARSIAVGRGYPSSYHRFGSAGQVSRLFAEAPRFRGGSKRAFAFDRGRLVVAVGATRRFSDAAREANLIEKFGRVSAHSLSSDHFLIVSTL